MEVLKGSCLCGKVKLEWRMNSNTWATAIALNVENLLALTIHRRAALLWVSCLLSKGKRIFKLIRKVKIPSYVFVAIAAQVCIRKRITESSIFA